MQPIIHNISFDAGANTILYMTGEEGREQKGLVLHILHMVTACFVTGVSDSRTYVIKQLPI